MTSLDILIMAAGKGTPLRLHGEGEQAEEALDALCALIEDFFEEGE